MHVPRPKNVAFKITKPPAEQITINPDNLHQASPGFFRRIAVILYDALLLAAVLFFATALALPFNNGEAFTDSRIIYPAYLVGISFAFYGWFWTHGGQTLGLKTWKFQVLTSDRLPISWKQAVFRFCLGFLSLVVFGLGFFWIFIDKNNLAFHDRLSKTRLYPVQ